MGFSSRGHSLKLFGVLKGIDMLPSSDMEVRLSPLLRVQRLRRTQRHSLYLFVVSKHAPNRLFVSRVLARSERRAQRRTLDMGVRDPLLPSGTPPPLGIEFSSPKMRDLLLSFTKNFGDRTHITKRMPVLAEHPSRGEEGDSTRTAPVSV